MPISSPIAASTKDGLSPLRQLNGTRRHKSSKDSSTSVAPSIALSSISNDLQTQDSVSHIGSSGYFLQSYTESVAQTEVGDESRKDDNEGQELMTELNELSEMDEEVSFNY